METEAKLTAMGLWLRGQMGIDSDAVLWWGKGKHEDEDEDGGQ